VPRSLKAKAERVIAAEAAKGGEPSIAAAKPRQRSSAFVAEHAGINLYSEYSLHAQLKEHLAAPGDRLEARVEGKVVDLVRSSGELVEVQTGHLGQIVPKVLALAAAGHKVRVVYPISVEREIRRLDPKTGELLSVRKSPKRGDLYQLFDELVKATGLIASHNVSVELIFVRSSETKTRDGSGSWRRRGDKTLDRELLEVVSSRSFKTRAQWLALIPRGLEEPFSSASLAAALEVEAEAARKILYCLARAGLLAESGKSGRLKLYARVKRS
jgi:hypothetical protein